MRSLGGIDDSLKEQLTTDYRTADISEQDKLVLSYAEKTTLDAASIDYNYITNLKSRGMTDKMLHDAVQVTAYFNYVNRIADALGVELEED